MITHIETENIIASYDDNTKLRNEVFEKVIELFTKHNFYSWDIRKSGESNDLIEEIEDLISFTLKYKEDES